MKDKRKFIRIPESAEISYRLISKKRSTGAISKDISKGGLRFYVREFVPKNSILKIKISIKKIPYLFEASVKVKWIRKIFDNDIFEIGAEFMEFPRDGFLELDRYIRISHTPEEKIQNHSFIRKKEKNEKDELKTAKLIKCR